MPPQNAARLPNYMDQVARTRARQNSGTTDIGQRRRFNFSDAGGPWTITDSPTNEEFVISMLGGAANLQPSADTTIPANYSMVVSGVYEIPLNVTVEIASNSYLEIL